MKSYNHNTMIFKYHKQPLPFNIEKSTIGKKGHNPSASIMINMKTTNHLSAEEMLKSATQASSLLKLIAHPHRLMILCLLLESERSVTELVDIMGINQTAMSNHLAKLRSEGLVEFTRYHRVLQYRLNSPEAEAIIGTLYELYCPPKK